ncbi:transporter substrate-binding domain-containing protein [Halomonas sp. LR3S48]|uniref:substrate-binding periplasmic protein n=1 Tax=Halomonadaceae TaxID=28256 RepID=UPI0021E4DCED|nr:transporter substrate-binding domain-containing protein [Halomonas sp. LR3S48]UYG02788.1 transporter substrate-binding domain-containing protein [Halomonas sp. LR3S48]
MNAIRWIFMLALTLGSPVQASDSALDRPPERTYDIVVESGYLNVGLYRDFPPYSYLEGSEPAGVDVAIGQRIAEELGVEFRVHWITPDETLEDDLRNNVWKGHYLAKRRIADVMLRVPYDRRFAYMRDSTGEVINDQVVMFGPYQQERWQIAHDAEALDSVSTLGVFQYHPIGVEIDTLPDTYLSSSFGGALRDNTHHFRDVGRAFEAMAEGRVHAVMGTRAEIDHQLVRHADRPFRAADNGFPGLVKQTWDVGMAVKHTHRELGHVIEEVIDRLVREGEIAEIFARHGLRYSPPAYYDGILEGEEEP